MRTGANMTTLAGPAEELAVDAAKPAFYTQRGEEKAKATRMTRHIAALLRRYPFVLRLPYQVFSRAQARYTLGVSAVVFDARGRILIVEHAYHPQLPWGLPGGWVGQDEDPAEAVTRELKEELQLEADVLSVVHTGKTAKAHVDLAFLCQAKCPVGKLSHELLAYDWFEADRLPRLKSFHHRAILASQAWQPRSETWERA